MQSRHLWIDGMELNQLLCVYSLKARMLFNREHKWGELCS